MSSRIRGQEVILKVTVDGQDKKGSFLKVTDFTARPRSDINEDDFLGEAQSDLDFQHHGWDVSFSVHVLDAATMDFVQEMVKREEDRLPPAEVTITQLYAFREPGEADRAAVYHQGILKVNEEGFKGRKERVTVEFEGKFKRRELISAA